MGKFPGFWLRLVMADSTVIEVRHRGGRRGFEIKIRGPVSEILSLRGFGHSYGYISLALLKNLGT